MSIRLSHILIWRRRSGDFNKEVGQERTAAKSAEDGLAERPASYNMPVKKHQLADMLAERMNVSKKQGMEWLDAFVDEVTKVLRKGDKVNITGFGIFKVADRKAREGINPRTQEKIHIAASKKPRFTPGKLLKEAVK